MAQDEALVEIEGRSLRLSNLNKVLYPEAGFSKGQMIDYYARIAPLLLPHLEGRPLTLKRYPNGVTGIHFYEKNGFSLFPQTHKNKNKNKDTTAMYFDLKRFRNT